jgi:hypothetical protein
MRTVAAVMALHAAALAFLATSSPASAQTWMSKVEKDDFGDNHVGIAMTEHDGRVFGLRCENKRVPTLIFATREKWGDGLGALPATLLVKVDNGDVVRKMATLESYPMMVGFQQVDGVRVIAPGDHIFPLLEAIAGAKRRIAVAVELAGQRFENTRFGVRNSRSAMKDIWRYCGSIAGKYDKPSL